VVWRTVWAKQFVLGVGQDGFGDDGIGIVVVKKHNVLVAATRSDQKLASLVAAHLPSDFNRLHVDPIGVNMLFGAWL
jgi:Ni,Fe-hydrogenase maturation factor